MQKPQKPYPPFEPHFAAKVERKYIYSFWQSLRADDYEDDEDEEKELPKKDISEVNLGWLLAQIPEGISPNQIKIEFGYNSSSMAYEDQYVKFYYEVKVPARVEELKAANKQYEADSTQYEVDLKAYKEWKRREEIRKAELRLAKLRTI